MTAIITALYTDQKLIQSLCNLSGYAYYPIQEHTFPDNESCLQISWDCKGKIIYFIATLDNPNAKIASLLFAAETLRQYGAEKIHLIAPYLPYMRQDKAFEPGQSITAHYFAKLVSNYFDGLITVDPHLHRIKNLSDIYHIPTKVRHASPLIAHWLGRHQANYLIVGPDNESEQWIQGVAQTLDAPFIALDKTRHGDRNVTITGGYLTNVQNKQPVLIDDMISSGHTLIQACNHLATKGLANPIIIAIHGLFVENAYKNLLPLSDKIITCNTIAHKSNAIDVAPLIAKAMIEIN